MGTGSKLGVVFQSGLLALAAVGVTAIPAAAGGTTITVNRVGDEPDSNGGTGDCDVDAAAGLQCTLRAAIQTANASPDQDTIEFAFGGSGVVKFKVPGLLPTITAPVVIDGYSASATSVNTAATGTNAVLRIVLNGAGIGSGDGLNIAAPSDISGLVIQDFSTAIFIAPGGDGSRIWGNFLGTTASGMRRARNHEHGLHVDCFSAVVIGGTTKARRNLISANRSGILLCEHTEGTKIQGNLVGVGANGLKDLGNDLVGVQAYGTQGVRIGGDTARTQNVIAFNGVGVAIVSDTGLEPHGVRVLRNSIHSNDALGIDLEWDGVTLNDGAGDPDTGANDLQNFPRVRSAVTRNGKTTIKGQLLSTPSRTFSLRLFVNPPGGDEGQKFLMKAMVTTNGAGKATFTLTAPSVVAVGKAITATATDNTLGQTSEFSVRRTVSN